MFGLRDRSGDTKRPISTNALGCSVATQQRDAWGPLQPLRAVRSKIVTPIPASASAISELEAAISRAHRRAGTPDRTASLVPRADSRHAD